MSRLLLLFFFLTFVVSLQAQDKHFTQFYASPLTLNPALTGAFNGRYRVSGNYRDQWRGVLDDPYVTFSTAIDVRFNVEWDSRYRDAIAVGLLFFSDKVSGVDFNTNQIALSVAFHKGLDFNGKQFLSGGIQAGLAQRNINYERLTFDDQFNSFDAFSLETAEDLPENNFAFSDYNVGINYSYTPRFGMLLNLGFSLHHILKPQLSFFPFDEGGNNNLFQKWSVQASFQFPVAEKVSLIPRALWAKQGPHQEITAGSNVRYAFADFNNNALQVGSWVRMARNAEGSMGLDALVLLVGLEISSVLIGLSYDVNLKALTTHSQGQGSFELSLAYLGDFENEAILCPKF